MACSLCDFPTDTAVPKFWRLTRFASPLQEPAEGRGGGRAEGSGHRELVAKMEVSIRGVWLSLHMHGNILAH